MLNCSNFQIPLTDQSVNTYLSYLINIMYNRNKRGVRFKDKEVILSGLLNLYICVCVCVCVCEVGKHKNYLTQFKYVGILNLRNVWLPGILWVK